MPTTEKARTEARRRRSTVISRPPPVLSYDCVSMKTTRGDIHLPALNFLKDLCSSDPSFNKLINGFNLLIIIFIVRVII